MKIQWMVLCGIGILCMANVGIWQKEQHIQDGTLLFLELAPRDPRSLMQGDYMQLGFAIERSLTNQLEQPLTDQDGWIVLDIDSEQRGEFNRIADTNKASQNQLAIRYKIRHSQLVLASNAYFFEEGLAKHFNAARYGEFRVNSDGKLLLVGLWDNELQPIRPRVYDKSSILFEN
jgi:uncharacterized membrane-anchored protein